MKIFKCPECKRIRPYSEGLVLVVCTGCQVEMEVVEENDTN